MKILKLIVLVFTLISCTEEKKDSTAGSSGIDLKYYHLNQSKAIRLDLKNILIKQDTLHLGLMIESSIIQNEQLHKAIIKSIIWNNESIFSEATFGLKVTIGNGVYLIDSNTIADLLSATALYRQMHEKSLYLFSDNTLIVIDEGISRLSDINQNIDRTSYFALLNDFANDQIRVEKQNNQKQILFNKSSYTLYELKNLSEFMSSEEFDIIEKLIDDIWRMRFNDGIESMIINKDSELYIKYDPKYLGDIYGV